MSSAGESLGELPSQRLHPLPDSFERRFVLRAEFVGGDELHHHPGGVAGRALHLETQRIGAQSVGGFQHQLRHPGGGELGEHASSIELFVDLQIHVETLQAQSLRRAGEYLDRPDDGFRLVAAISHGILAQHPDQGPDASDRVQADGLHSLDRVSKSPGVGRAARGLVTFPRLLEALAHDPTELTRQPQAFAAANLDDVPRQDGEAHLPALKDSENAFEGQPQEDAENGQESVVEHLPDQPIKTPHGDEVANSPIACSQQNDRRNRPHAVAEGESRCCQHEEHRVRAGIPGDHHEHQGQQPDAQPDPRPPEQHEGSHRDRDVSQNNQGAYLDPFEEKLQNIGKKLETYSEQDEPAPEVDQGDRRALLLSFLVHVPPLRSAHFPIRKPCIRFFQAIITFCTK